MVSVIIPAKDDQKIFRTITEVKKQEPDEIIVAVEASSSEVYKQALQESDATYVEVDGGTAVARNKGAEAAASDKLIFLDADCYPTAGWLEQMENALDEHDLVEGAVRYLGTRCPFNRLVENIGDEHRFLTANLGVRKEVFDEIQFDNRYRIFREDTDFGWRALEAGFTSTFVDAEVEHDAGRHSFDSFLNERFRYVSEPFFVQRFKDNELLETEVSRLGPMLYPKEFLMLLLLILSLGAAALTPFALFLTAGIAATLSSYYTYEKMRTKDAQFCIKDWLKGLYWVPLGIAVKRYALWKGAITYKVPVV